jgi:hypothetical protein
MAEPIYKEREELAIEDRDSDGVLIVIVALLRDITGVQCDVRK